jgi:hypothetical protein
MFPSGASAFVATALNAAAAPSAALPEINNFLQRIASSADVLLAVPAPYASTFEWCLEARD